VIGEIKLFQTNAST